MKNYSILLLAAFVLLPGAAGAAPPFPRTAKRKISLPEKGPLPVDATVAGLPVTLEGDTVNVSAGNNDKLEPVDLSKNALAPFTTLLRTYPHARSVELSWYEPLFLDANGADVLYDRARHTVTVDFNYGGGEEPQHTGRVRFTHVQESVFAAILKAHPNGVPENDREFDKFAATVPQNTGGVWGGFLYLYQPRYGCHLVVPHARRGHRHSRHGTR